MGGDLYYSYLFNACGNPTAGVPDIEAWGVVEGGDNTKATVKLGLFGYDITCIAKYCAVQ
jgi:hypothetical protein